MPTIKEGFYKRAESGRQSTWIMGSSREWITRVGTEIEGISL
jgi:hypothetical protein